MRILGLGCDGLLGDGVFRVGLGGGPFLELAVGEDVAGSYGGDEVGCVDPAPPVLGGVEELVVCGRHQEFGRRTLVDFHEWSSNGAGTR